MERHGGQAGNNRLANCVQVADYTRAQSTPGAYSPHQWRSQKCELGKGLASFPFPFFLSPPIPFLLPSPSPWK